MASITYFILLVLTLSSTIHARESQFFAKVSNNNPKDTLPLNTNQPQDLNFIPQTQQQDTGSYGLFGHESGQLPPSSTTNKNSIPTITATRLPDNLPENYNPVAYTTPIHSSTQDLPEEFKDPQPFNYNENGNGNDENMYNYEKQEVTTNGGNMYPEKQGMSDTRFTENGKYNYVGDNLYNSQNFENSRFMETEDGGNMYNNQKQGVNEMYNPEKQGMGEVKYSENTNTNGNMYNPEKQGMSDTRFLENGKYFYDLAMENANNANMYSRGVRNGYETQGYYGNKENSYERYNTNVGGYQNQGFQDNQVNMNQYNP